MLILCRFIERHELKPLSAQLGLDDLLEGGRKVLKGLA